MICSLIFEKGNLGKEEMIAVDVLETNSRPRAMFAEQTPMEFQTVNFGTDE